MTNWGYSGGEDVSAGSGDASNPWIPHLCLGKVELDEQFPPLAVPQEEDLLDLANDSDDHMLRHGFRIANTISDEMMKHGRTRRRMVNDDEAMCMLDDEDADDAYNNQDEPEHSVRCSESDDDSSTTTTAYNDDSSTTTTTHNCPTGRPLNNDNKQFLSDNDHCCPGSFHLSGEHASGTSSVSHAVGERLPHAGSATEVHAERSLGLRGSAKCGGTEGVSLATDTESMEFPRCLFHMCICCLWPMAQAFSS